MKIRHYGLLASGNATTKLEVARRLLEAMQPGLCAAIGLVAAVFLAAKSHASSQLPDDWRALLEQLTGIDLSRCPSCGLGTLRSHPLPRHFSTTKPPDDSS